MAETKIAIDEYGVGYLSLTSQPVSYSDEVADGVIADFDAAGRVVGLEFLSARRDAGRVHELIAKAENMSSGPRAPASSTTGRAD